MTIADVSPIADNATTDNGVVMRRVNKTITDLAELDVIANGDGVSPGSIVCYAVPDDPVEYYYLNADKEWVKM